MTDTIIINMKKSRFSASQCSDHTECIIFPKILVQTNDSQGGVARRDSNQKRMKHAGIQSIKLYYIASTASSSY